MSAVLVDTNVLVYAVDVRERGKHKAAERVLSHIDFDDVCVSPQVLSEYANVLTHPSKHALPPDDVIPDIIDMETAWRMLPVTADTVIAALEAKERWQLAFYDAQIWATAALNAVPIVLSEDFADGLSLGGVRFVNPFGQGFEISQLQ